MASPKPRLVAAQRHGRRALSETRHLMADAALYWVLSHRARVAQFRRAIKGGRAERALDTLLAAIREEASELPQPRPRARPKRRATAPRRRARRQRTPSWLRLLPSQPLPL